MKLMTVKEYAKHINRSIPLIYKQIDAKRLKTVVKYGRILIPVKEESIKELQAEGK